MNNEKHIELDFEIDCLTNSIRNITSGDSFDTNVTYLTKRDLKNIGKKNNWKFNWKAEFDDDAKEVYKLTIINNPNVIQGLISLSVEADHIFMNLLESAPFNFGKGKVYEGVAGNLVAYACKRAFQLGFDGYIAFTAKTKLIEHYKNTLGAYLIGSQRMAIDKNDAKILADKYFKNY